MSSLGGRVAPQRFAVAVAVAVVVDSWMALAEVRSTVAQVAAAVADGLAVEQVVPWTAAPGSLPVVVAV